VTTRLVPPKPVARAATRAITEFDMIRPDDRVLVALSGGKDSLTLLHTLLHLQRRAPARFKLGAATVDPGIEGFDPSYLETYVPALGIPLFYRREKIVERALKTMRGDSFCAYCARMRRGILYDVARKEGYPVLALGHHLDDLAESFLMSAFFGGRLGTMKAHYRNDAGDLRIIRPLVYVRERQTRDFAERQGLPAIRDNCPACFTMPSQRQKMKELLAGMEKEHPVLFRSLRSAMEPLLRGKIPKDFPPTGEELADFGCENDTEVEISKMNQK
jgi:tRNA 2-thiocytidine biosynthesis protein TtcA